MAREGKAQKHVLTAYNRDNHMLMRRKKVDLACCTLRPRCSRVGQVVDPYELVLVKLPPPPLPTSWGRMVKPYMPPEGARPMP